MARLNAHHRVTVSGTITFDEAELRALDGLIGYGADAFVKVFYEHLGKAYMEPNESGLRSLFATLGEPMRAAIHDVDRARKDLEGGG